MQPPDAELRSLLLVLHRAFVEVRNRSEPGSHLYDLADTFEVIPERVARPGGDTFEQVRALLADYQAQRSEGGYEYVSLLSETSEAATAGPER